MGKESLEDCSEWGTGVSVAWRGVGCALVRVCVCVCYHAHVHMIVGVHGLLGAQLATHDLNGAVGNDLVHVHVGLSARAGLEDDLHNPDHKLSTVAGWLSAEPTARFCPYQWKVVI